MISLSIIIPTLNESQNIELLIPKLQSFNKQYVEIIFADAQASTDNLRGIVTAQNYKYVKCSKTSRASQMNEGAKVATGKIICFLHADVLPPENMPDYISESISQNYKFGFFSYQFYPTSFLLKINSYFTKFDGVFAGGGDQIHFMTRDVFKQLNGYDEEAKIMEDFYFFQKVKRSKIQYCIIDHPATVSARKYEKNSYLSVNFTNLIAFLLFKFNINSKIIKKWCCYMLK